jgi:hypothetical protein
MRSSATLALAGRKPQAINSEGPMTAVPAAAAVLVHGAGPAARLGQNCNSVEPHDVAAAAAVVAAAVAPAAASDVPQWKCWGVWLHQWLPCKPGVH